MTNIDPRAAGFNYGVGWGSTQLPPTYYRGKAVADDVAHMAQTWGRIDWQLQMALRKVRHASTQIEKTVALTALDDLIDRINV